MSRDLSSSRITCLQQYWEGDAATCTLCEHFGKRFFGAAPALQLPYIPSTVLAVLRRLRTRSVVTDELLDHVDSVFGDLMECDTLANGFERYLATRTFAIPLSQQQQVPQRLPCHSPL